MVFLLSNLLTAFFAYRETLSGTCIPISNQSRSFYTKHFSVSWEVPDGLSVVFMAHIISEHLLKALGD